MRPTRAARAASVLVLLATACSSAPGPVAACVPPPRSTSLSVPYWYLDDGTKTVRKHEDQLDAVSPWVHGVAPDGSIAPQTADGPDEAMHLESLLVTGPEMVPTISNHFDGEWRREPLSGILRDPARTREHVEDLTQFALDGGYRTLDIDYENLHPADVPAFTRFIRLLADRLHAEDRRLSVNLPAKTADDGSDNDTTVAMDYRAVGEAADFVRLMVYDYHWETSEPGPAAPDAWVRDVLTYARTRMPAHKVVLGIGVYGYDWSRGRGDSVSSAGALGLADRYGARPVRDEESGSLWFEYRKDGVHHVVWFEDTASVAVKLRLARELGISAVHLWSYGPEAPGLWEELDAGWKQACP